MARHEITIPEVGVVGHFDLEPMPRCPKVAISHSLEINSEHRGKGFGRLAMEQRLQLAKSLGFQVIICTVREGNTAQERIMSRFNFRRITFFDNPTTDHRVGLWYKNINDPYDCGFYEGAGCR